MAAVLALGLYQQHARRQRHRIKSGAGASSPAHSYAIPIYLHCSRDGLVALVFLLGGRAPAWWQVVGPGGWTLKQLWHDVFTDLAVMLPFWAVWEGPAYGVHLLLGSDFAKTVDSLLPKSLVEVLVWIATCVTAGICEEMAFRGYLQRQFHALTGNIAWAHSSTGSGLQRSARVSGMAKRGGHQCSWRSLRRSRRMAQKPSCEHHLPCLVGYLGGLAEVGRFQVVF